MARLILIETSTALCSVALAENGKITAYRESSEPKAHASLTAVFVDEVLREAGLSIHDCDGVCVSKGPGSYTGLRVGVSTAKGLCFGAGIPLLAVSTTEILARMAVSDKSVNSEYAVAMLDARRMEVYAQSFRLSGDDANPFSAISAVEAKIIDEYAYSELTEKGSVIFIGDGAGKCEGTIRGESVIFRQCFPSAKAMAEEAEKAYTEKRFEDTAYFEPFYLKEFVATVSKKDPLHALSSK